MKIAVFLENERHIGGGDYFIYQLATRLDHDVTIFAKNRYGFFEDVHSRGSLPRFVKGMGFLNRRYTDVYDALVLNRWFSNNTPDIVVGYLRDAAIRAQQFGERYQSSVINFVFENPQWMKQDLGKRWEEEYRGRFRESWNIAKKAYKKSKVLLSISKTAQEKAEKWLGRNLQGFVYPGINQETADSASAEKRNQIIYVGRLNAFKNVADIFHALHSMKDSPRFVIIGQGEQERYLKKLADELDIPVEFKGTVTEKQKFEEIKKSLFMVFPSSHEGFGMPPMEALYCRVPCICTDKPIFHEVYKDYVEYVPEHDIKALTGIMEKLKKDDEYRRQKGILGREHAKKFSWEASARNFETLVGDVI